MLQQEPTQDRNQEQEKNKQEPEKTPEQQQNSRALRSVVGALTSRYPLYRDDNKPRSQSVTARLERLSRGSSNAPIVGVVLDYITAGKAAGMTGQDESDLRGALVVLANRSTGNQQANYSEVQGEILTELATTMNKSIRTSLSTMLDAENRGSRAKSRIEGAIAQLKSLDNSAFSETIEQLESIAKNSEGKDLDWFRKQLSDTFGKKEEDKTEDKDKSSDKSLSSISMPSLDKIANA